MTFAEWCEIAENTEEEKRFFKFLQRDDMQKLEAVFNKLQRLPFIGKVFAAMNALDAYETLAEYRQSEHYELIKDWEFQFDAEKGIFNLYAGTAQRRKFFKIFAAIAAVIGIIILYRKFCCRNKK